MPDYGWWQANGSKVKARLTRAERMVKTDPARALSEAFEVDALMQDHGYPDWWHRVERLEQDARYAQALAE